MAVNDYVLKMTPEQLNEHINVKKSIWFSKYSTNCYAYALGLDIPEKNICYNCNDDFDDIVLLCGRERRIEQFG